MERPNDLKIGDKFVVVHPSQYTSDYKNELPHMVFNEGDILTLIYDDGTEMPSFCCEETAVVEYCSFHRLIPHKESKSNKREKFFRVYADGLATREFDHEKYLYSFGKQTFYVSEPYKAPIFECHIDRRPAVEVFET